MEDEFLKQPNGNEVPPQILNSNRFYPFFKDCVGAIDGTHVRVKVHRAEAVRFRGRKQYPTQNVLMACAFDMKFTYVLPGWEGTASDSRILRNALSRSDKLIIPQERMAGGQNNETRGGKSKKDILQWNYEMDSMLLHALLDEQSKGNRPDGTFTHEATTNVLKLLRSYFGSHFQPSHIKNRLKTLKSKFNDWKDLFHGMSGFSWNPTTQMFDATNEVWVQLIQEKPEAKKWMRARLENYDLLYELYGQDRATGQYAESAKEKVHRWQREGTTSQIDLNDSLEHVIMSDNENAYSPDYAHSNDSNATMNSRGSKRKASMMEMRQYDMINMGMKEVADVMREGNIIAEKSIEIAGKSIEVAEKQLALTEKSVSVLEHSRPHCYREDEIFDELERIGVQGNFQVNAYLFLTKHPNKARAFFGFPRSRRLEILVQLMNEGSS